MTTKLILFYLILTGISSGFSQQTVKDSLSIEEGFWGLIYKQGDRELSSKEFRQILNATPDVTISDQYSGGNTMSTLGNVLGGAGGFCLGYGLFSKPTNTPLTVAGGIAAVAGIVLDLTGKSKMRDAVTRYNHQSEAAGVSVLPPLNPRQVLVYFSMRF